MGDQLDMTSLLRLALSFGVIIAALLALKWWTHRGGVTATKSAIKIAGRTGVSRGAVVCIVEADSRRFLVGVTEHGISLLSELRGTAEVMDLTEGVVEQLPQQALDLDAELSQLTSSASVSSLLAESSDVDWQDQTEVPGTGTSPRPWNGLLRRAQALTLRAPSQVPVHAQRS
jgi:flagellar biogenesis protein FliO